MIGGCIVQGYSARLNEFDDCYSTSGIHCVKHMKWDTYPT